MKYCPNCGIEITNEESKFCHSCGSKLDVSETKIVEDCNTLEKKSNTLHKVAWAFLIVTMSFNLILTLILPFYIISYAWMIPMFVSMTKKMKKNQPIGVGFGVCTLLFFNLISGILILCAVNE